jgi:hypothetical protein
MNREETIILAAAAIYASPTRWTIQMAVQQAFKIEEEVTKQREAQDKARVKSMEEFVAQIPPPLIPAPYDLSKGPAFD